MSGSSTSQVRGAQDGRSITSPSSSRTMTSSLAASPSWIRRLWAEISIESGTRSVSSARSAQAATSTAATNGNVIRGVVFISSLPFSGPTLVATCG